MATNKQHNLKLRVVKSFVYFIQFQDATMTLKQKIRKTQPMEMFMSEEWSVTSVILKKRNEAILAQMKLKNK